MESRNAIKRISFIIPFMILYIIFFLWCPKVEAATSPPAITIDIDEKYVDKLIFHVRASASESIITNTTFYYSYDGNNWAVRESINASPTTTAIDFMSVFSESFMGSSLDTVIYYKVSTTYLDGGTATTITTAVQTVRYNLIPTIMIDKTAYVDGVRFLITINTNGNPMGNAYFNYHLINDTESHQVLLNAENRVASNQYAVKVRFTSLSVMHSASLSYQDSLKRTWSIDTEKLSAWTCPPPEIGISYRSADTESVTVEAYLSSRGNKIIEWYIAYQVPGQEKRKAYGTPSGIQKYTVILTGLPSDSTVEYQMVVIYQAIDDPVSMLSDSKTAQTNALPDVYSLANDIDFDRAVISCSIVPNGNTIQSSELEYRLGSASIWQRIAGQSFDEFMCTLNGLTPGSTLHYRLHVFWQTTGGIRSVYSDEDSKPLYRCKTQADYFQWTYVDGQSDGDLRVFGDFIVYWVVPSDQSHLDKGFIWSESMTPMIGSASRLSLGTEDTSVSGVTLSAQLNNLVIGKTYYYRAYVIREDSSVYYGNIVTFIPFSQMWDVISRSFHPALLFTRRKHPARHITSRQPQQQPRQQRPIRHSQRPLCRQSPHLL